MPPTTKLVSPVSDRTQLHISAPRPFPNSQLSILLIDGMLNRRAGWGGALLDGAEDVLSTLSRATFERVDRIPGSQGFSEDDAWARGMIGSIDLVVEAVGD
jgi:hypothetical protein